MKEETRIRASHYIPTIVYVLCSMLVIGGETKKAAVGVPPPPPRTGPGRWPGALPRLRARVSALQRC